MKRCLGCEETKAKKEFSIQVGGFLCTRCKACMALAARDKRKKNPERARAYNRMWCKKNQEKVKKSNATWKKKNPHKVREASIKARFKRYGMTIGDYDELFAEQGGTCAICHTDTPGSRSRFMIDHDHDTGKIRGLLCHKCNVMLGMANDSEIVLSSAIYYLKHHRQGGTGG